MMTYERRMCNVLKNIYRFLGKARESVSACKYQVCAKKQVRHTRSCVQNKVLENKVDVCNTVLEY